MFDAAMLPGADSDAGLIADAGTTDATVARGEGEPCSADRECRSDLECHGATCSLVGGVDEPCTRAGTCEADLMCVELTCRATANVRLCHCVYTASTMSSRTLEMWVGSTIVGPTQTNVCSPCTPVPLGTDLPLEIRDSTDGRLYQSATLDVTGDPPVLTIAFSSGVFEVVAGHCEPATGFCG